MESTMSNNNNIPNNQPDQFIMVIFGASGDLTMRKLIPAMYKNFLEGLLPDKYCIVGYARRDYSDDDFRNQMKEAIETLTKHHINDETWLTFSKNLYYQKGDLGEEKDFASLKERLESLTEGRKMPNNYLFYLSTQPSYFTTITGHLGKCGLSQKGNQAESPWSRIIIEKPFGHDLESALALNESIEHSFEENQVYRIDHYLGKETVQNIMVHRFGNSIFEPLWNHKYIDNIQITVAETLGVESRAAYYEKSGAMRDIVQNHMMHLIALVGMEIPMSLSANSVRDEKVKVLKALRPFTASCVANDVVRAQYASGIINNEKVTGYLHEPGVAEDSSTETFIAFKTYIDNWRWAGVPFYVRSGKRLPSRVTEIAIYFSHVPNILFNQPPYGPMAQNVLVMRIQPDESIMLQFQVKFPGLKMRIEPLKMDFGYSETFGKEPPEAYERLLLDALLGDSTLFTRIDEVEASWRFFSPIIEGASKPDILLPSYRSGTWGPQAAHDLIERDGRKWQIFPANTTSPSSVCHI